MTSTPQHLGVSIERAVALPTCHPFSKFALPADFSYMVDGKTGRVVEPVLLFLCHQYLVQTARWNKNTVEAAAYDLRDWWAYLQYKSMQWDEVDDANLIEYRNTMLDTVSPKTHMPYSPGTIARRMRVVMQFYEYSAARGWYHGDLREHAIVPRASGSLDRDVLAHVRVTGRRKTSVTILPRSIRTPDDSIRPLSSKEWLRIAREIGPLPTEQYADPRPARNRLAAELSLLTGMRVDEVASLTIYQILDLRPDLDDQSGVTPLRITKTKRLKPRTVLVPNFLIPELIAYADGERKAAVDAAKKIRLTRHSKTSASFFVNSDASRHPGKGVSTETLSDAFRIATIAALLTTTIVKTDPDSSEQYIERVASHSFHDLRHTFAVWLYQAEKAAGNAEPWKVVQARLGHAYLHTTLDTYLRVVSFERAEIGANYYSALKRMSSSEY